MKTSFEVPKIGSSIEKLNEAVNELRKKDKREKEKFIGENLI